MYGWARVERRKLKSERRYAHSADQHRVGANIQASAHQIAKKILAREYFADGSVLLIETRVDTLRLEQEKAIGSSDNEELEQRWSRSPRILGDVWLGPARE